MSKWYVVCDKWASEDARAGEAVWTLSKDPNAEGWCTDSGTHGYGLTRKDADELCEAANSRQPTKGWFLAKKDTLRG